MLNRHAYRVAAIFVSAGLISRFTFRRFETRWQILILWAAAAGYQLVLRPALGKRISVATLFLDVVAIAIAVTAMKVAIEGRL